jgi:hypothetical protein
MTFLAPAYLLGALVVASGIVLLHLIVTKQPRSSVFPTARFVPELPAKATSRATRPADLLLMLLRVLVVVAAGAGLARPVVHPSRTALGRVILADVSRAVGSEQEVTDSLRRLASNDAVVVVFDSAARRITGADSLTRVPPTTARANLSTALIAAVRAASQLRDRVDSVELVIVSPLVVEEWDAATKQIRALWPGRARLVRVAPRVAVAKETTIESIDDAGDPLRVTTGVVARKSGTIPVRIVRNAVSDTSVAIGSNEVVVRWPISERPRLAIPRVTVDSPGAVISRNAVVVASFERKWSYPVDSLRGATVVARWVDGEPAAVETPPEPSSCSRSVAIPVAPIGDLVIRPEFARLVGDLTASCGDPFSIVALSNDAIAALRGGASLAPASAFQARSDVPSPIAPWLLGLALLGAIAELLVRGRSNEIASFEDANEKPEAKVA